MRAIVLFFLISGILSGCGDNSKNANSSENKIQIISTIKPIQAIVLAITGEKAQTIQLIPDYASPHNYSFKPSDIRKVNNADVIFRIDEHMEAQLNAVFKNLDKNTKLISLAEVSNIKLLEANDIHLNKADHKTHGNIDFHIWTSPNNAKQMAKTIADTLSDMDKSNEEVYQQNYAQFATSLYSESEKIKAKLSQYQNDKYIVFHNSWQYFAKEFGLQKPLVVDLHEGISSGAKTVSSIQEQIKKEDIRCVFYDSSVSKDRLQLLTENIKSSKIDVLAQVIDISQNGYILWLNQLATQVETCLSKNN